MTSIIRYFALAVAVEALTELIVASEIMAPIRYWWKSKIYSVDKPPKVGVTQSIYVFIDKLISCGYCTSVWVAASAAIFAPPILGFAEDDFFGLIFVDWFVGMLILHRVSNLIHVLYELVRKGRVSTMDLVVNLVMSEQGEVEEQDGTP